MMVRTKGEATRERILDMAVAEAAAVGLEGLSIGGLARAADMSKSGLFAHFGSKEELQLAVLEAARHSFIDEVFQPALGDARGEPRLRSLFEHWLGWIEQHQGGCPILAATYEFDDRPGAVRERVVTIQAELIAALEKAARLALEQGHFGVEADPAQFAFELHGILLSFHVHCRLLHESTSHDAARAAFDALIERQRPAATS